MSLLQLVLKQMRQRSLGTALTLLSVMLGVALAISIMILRREAGQLFSQTDYGYDVLIGNKRSSLQLVLNTIYHVDRSPGNIPFSVYEAMIRNPTNRREVKIAVPFAVGDVYSGHRIVATHPKLFGIDDEGKPLPEEKILEYRPGRRFEITEGQVFHKEKFEAIAGCEVPLKVGAKFQATHSAPNTAGAPTVHDEEWTVVGRLKPTHTAADRVIYIPLTSFFTISGHGEGLFAQAMMRMPEAKTEAEPNPTEAYPGVADLQARFTKPYSMREDGTIDLKLPKEVWALSGIMVKARSPAMGLSLMYRLNNGSDVSAVNPAIAMREFFQNFIQGPSLLLLAIACLVTVVAAVGILVSIYNSIAARTREIAVMRALGATRVRILNMVCLEAALIGLCGGIAGVAAGHLLAAAGSRFFESYLGESINWTAADRYELYYLGAVVLLSALAGLVPAIRAYRAPVATYLAGRD